MNKKIILLIEDCQFSRNHIQEALKIFPEIKMIVKETAEDALTYLDKKPKLDLMLIDIGLPKMNGVVARSTYKFSSAKEKIGVLKK